MFIKQVNLIAGFFPFLSASSLVISLHGTVYRPDDVQVINTAMYMQSGPRMCNGINCS